MADGALHPRQSFALDRIEAPRRGVRVVARAWPAAPRLAADGAEGGRQGEFRLPLRPPSARRARAAVRRRPVAGTTRSAAWSPLSPIPTCSCWNARWKVSPRANRSLSKRRGGCREFFSKAPALSPWRVAIIDAADDLNTNSANAVLKTLEEPSGRGVPVPGQPCAGAAAHHHPLTLPPPRFRTLAGSGAGGFRPRSAGRRTAGGGASRRHGARRARPGADACGRGRA